MKEQGIVTKLITTHLVEVGFQKSEACVKCKACHAVGEGMMGIEAVNNIGAKREDVVEIDIPSGEIVKGSILVFLVPILFLIMGYLVGATIVRSLDLQGWEEAVGIVLGLLSMALGFFAVHWYDKNIQQKEACRARILKIVKTK